jgi:biopolymer transport protein ExbD
MKFPSRPPAAPMHLNITSLLDVCFLLLAFFIASSAFPSNEGILPATLPKPPGSHDPSPQPIPPVTLNISLHSRGGDDVAIDIPGMVNPPTDFNQLADRLAGLRADTYLAADPVDIAVDDAIAWQHVANAFNAVRRAGFTNVTLGQLQP